MKKYFKNRLHKFNSYCYNKSRSIQFKNTYHDKKRRESMEFMDKINQKLDMLDKIYLARQEELEQENKEMKENLKKQLNKVSLEEVEEAIEKQFQKIENNQLVNKEILNEKEEIINKIELLIENYELQIAYYSEKNYKRGFKDAICLCIQCFSNADDEK